MFELTEDYNITIASPASDQQAIKDLILDCCKESIFSKQFINFDDIDTVALTFSSGVNKEWTLILLNKGDTPVGFLAATKVTMHVFGPRKPLACEIAWWVRPEHRSKTDTSKMLEAYEEWAKFAGCSNIQMGCVINEYTPKLRKLYKKHGFQQTEEWYVKDLNND